jgi:hypothetical protein
VYSIPEVASGFDANANSLGDISFDLNTPIIKNGQSISKYEIEELDVVYSVTDISGSNRSIFVYDNRAEGTVKAFSKNGPNPTSIQIDNANYNFSKDMELSALSQIKIGDKVAALIGYDGKVVAVRKITYKTGNKTEARILGNSKTSDNLNYSQVLTDLGKYNVLSSVGALELGSKYIVSIDEDIIVKAEKQNNSLETYGVRSVSNNIISYGTGEDLDTFELPQALTYYYHSENTDYEIVLGNLKLGSSVILSKNNGSYDYGVIVDPVYSMPTIKTFNSTEDYETMYNNGAMFIYREGEYSYNPYAIEIGDVVYEVSDLLGKHKYIYVLDTEVDGEVKMLSPNKINPETIKIGNTTYSFSKYFDKEKLRDVENESYVTVNLDIEGKIIDINVY